jgi:hypothetical protein
MKWVLQPRRMVMYEATTESKPPEISDSTGGVLTESVGNIEDSVCEPTPDMPVAH